MLKNNKNEHMKNREDNVVPDKIDIRDRMYQPAVTTAPRKEFIQQIQLPYYIKKKPVPDQIRCLSFRSVIL